MDIALLKIDANETPHTPPLKFWFCENWRMGFGGGNPYNLTSTVTAGIVSAKARGTRNSILYSNRRSGKPRKQRRRSGKYTRDLIGINTMISMTGSYVGYSLRTV
jgi:hypothetical protein